MHPGLGPATTAYMQYTKCIHISNFVSAKRQCHVHEDHTVAPSHAFRFEIIFSLAHAHAHVSIQRASSVTRSGESQWTAPNAN